MDVKNVASLKCGLGLISFFLGFCGGERKKTQLVHMLSFQDTSLCGDGISCRGGNSLCRDACARNAHGFALIALFRRLSFDFVVQPGHSDVANVLPVGWSVTGLQCFPTPLRGRIALQMN